MALQPGTFGASASVGKAAGAERFLGRWSDYARSGHGDNGAIKDLAGADASHARHFQFSILRVFSPSAPAAQLDAAEAHFRKHCSHAVSVNLS
ncbi:hypothetical protein [Arthrobacter sp. B3I4]|uniref:hypothetical protein n=1 Tax=Arthrobacter sp. B3I4 TaxID=3042267 RepID=UPI00278B08CC|nr:hypothetical protein [Arthrobacter sp. B3I4]MDQ0757306.1 hypothetical protein [Arthrobacter sp. B3I4]